MELGDGANQLFREHKCGHRLVGRRRDKEGEKGTGKGGSGCADGRLNWVT